MTFDALAYITARLSEYTYADWAWHMQPGKDELSWAVALTLFAAGLAAVCFYGARDVAGETG